jgi:ubiquinone/menaquinone biosynthesis C-methylase UbiE
MTEHIGTHSRQDSTQLYSTKAQKYTRFRPDFNPEAIASFVEISGLRKDSVVADVGSGTGILTRHLLDHFDTVYAVEPNDAMRQVAEANLGENPGFSSLAAPAEKIPLPDDSIELITVGQAIHWFQPEPALAEFQRIAKPGAWLLLATITTLDEKLKDAVRGIFTEENGIPPKTQQTPSRDVPIRYFFANGEYKTRLFPHLHPETWESFLGGIGTASFAPDEGHPRYKNFKTAARQVFDRFSQNGILNWQIATEISCGFLKERSSS